MTDRDQERTNKLTEWMIRIGTADHAGRIKLLEEAGSNAFDTSSHVAARSFLTHMWSGLNRQREQINDFLAQPKKASEFKKRYAESKDFRKAVAGSMYLASYELAHRSTPPVDMEGGQTEWPTLLVATVGDTAEREPFLARALVTAAFIAQTVTMIKDGASSWSDCLGTVERARVSVEKDTEDHGALTKELLLAGIEDARRWLNRARTEAMAVDLSGKHTPMETEGSTDE